MSDRYRTKGAVDTSAVSTQQSLWGSCSQSSWTTGGTQPLFATGKWSTMRDTVTPGFYKKRQSGEVVMNPFLQTNHEAKRTSGGVGPERHQLATINCSGSLQNPATRDLGNQVENFYSVAVGQLLTLGRLPPLLDLFTGSDISAALTECSTSVQNSRGRSDGNLWETLAESDKALGTLTGIFKSAYRTIRARDIRGFTRDSTGGYLGWRYGIKPLISDVQMVMSGLDKKVGRLRKTSRAKISFDRLSNKIVTFHNSAFDVAMQEIASDRYEIRGMSLDEHIVSEANNIGLTSKGLITLPWELVRYSFVLDWFANVGDFLGAITPAFGWTQLGSCYVIKRYQGISIGALNTTPGAGFAIDVPCSGGFTYLRDTRQRIVGLPAPSIVVRSDFRFSNLTRCLDAFSLLAQRVVNRR